MTVEVGVASTGWVDLDPRILHITTGASAAASQTKWGGGGGHRSHTVIIHTRVGWGGVLIIGDVPQIYSSDVFGWGPLESRRFVWATFSLHRKARHHSGDAAPANAPANAPGNTPHAQRGGRDPPSHGRMPCCLPTRTLSVDFSIDSDLLNVPQFVSHHPPRFLLLRPPQYRPAPSLWESAFRGISTEDGISS